MKQVIFLVMLSTFFAGFNSAVHAQNLGGGLIIGVNTSQIDGDASAGFNRIGLSAGGFAMFQLSDRFLLQPELVYDQLGSASRDGFLSLRFHYISIPMMAQFTLPIAIENSSFKLKAHIGPAPGVLMRARDLVAAPPANDLTSQQRLIDLKAGAGLSLQLSEGADFCVRYYYSLFPFSRGTSLRFLTGPFHNAVHFSLRFWVSR